MKDALGYVLLWVVIALIAMYTSEWFIFLVGAIFMGKLFYEMGKESERK